MGANTKIGCGVTLEAKVIRKDGTIEDLGMIASSRKRDLPKVWLSDLKRKLRGT